MGHNFLCYATRILALSEEALAMSRAGVPRWGRWKAPPPPVCWPPTINIFPKYPYRLSLAPPARLLTAFAPARWWTGRWSMTTIHGCVSFRETLGLTSSPDQAAITSAKDIAGQTVFAFRHSCSYRQKLESWFYADGVNPGTIMEIQSYHAMQASGVALRPCRCWRSCPAVSG